MLIVVVCTGNTCRSPLAAAMLSDRLLKEHALQDCRVESAGTNTSDGLPASEGSFLTARELGLNLSHHRSRQLTAEMVADADLILTMTANHLDAVESLGGQGKSATLLGFGGSGKSLGIPDPFGGDLDVYRGTAVRLRAAIDQVVARLLADNRP